MRQFTLTLLVVWIASSIGAFFYSQQQNIPRTLLIALLPAFLLEIGFYLMPAFEGVRRAFDALGSKQLRAGLLVAAGMVPYLVESLRTGTFALSQCLMLFAVITVLCFWYAFLKPSPLVDLLFLAFAAVVFVAKVFPQIYIRPTPHLQIEILGKMMWIRVGAMALLSLRRIDNVRFGLLPNSAEWRIGIEYFLYFLPVGAFAAYFLQFARFHPLQLIWWKIALLVPATFFGALWVVALGEEFFFRGFLQQVLSRGLHSETAGVLTTAILFGCSHLFYRAFPNWRFAVVAGIAGLFYGIAFLRSRSIRASMVTHALVVTTWRTLFVS